MRVVALLATYNEERFIAATLDHLLEQGVDVYLIDNCSTDGTLEVATNYLDRGVIGIETLPRAGVFDLKAVLRRKEELAASLDGDWFIHLDADEFRLPPNSHQTLAQALADVDAQGYNAVNFQEFAFVPTKESPDHDHPNFVNTMRWYYPFNPRRASPHRLNAWKAQREPVDLVSKAGHRVKFPGLRMYPTSFKLRHYLYLSVPHAERKYGKRRHSPEALARGWHRWREYFDAERVNLPSETELRAYISDDLLDSSNPRLQHDMLSTTVPLLRGCR